MFGLHGIPIPSLKPSPKIVSGIRKVEEILEKIQEQILEKIQEKKSHMSSEQFLL
jgi:hypothetical protein